MQKLEIGPNEAGQRLDKYLRKLLPKAEKSFLYKMLRKKNIVLNGKKTEGCVHLTAGDCVTLFFSDETFRKFSPEHSFCLKKNSGKKSGSPKDNRNAPYGYPMPDILYETKDLLILNKPAGLLSQKSAPSDISANELVIQYLLDSGAITQQTLKTFRPSVCNRLDRNTSGILIAGKTLRGLQEVSAHLRNRTMQKYYRCIVYGNIDSPQRLKGFMIKDSKSNRSQIISSVSSASFGQYIETSYEPVCQYDGYTMLEVHLITGRSHQIRAHLASEGHPVIGDSKYGIASVNNRFRVKAGIASQLLHCFRIVFPDGLEITAPLPDTFGRAVNAIEKQ